MAFPIIHLAVAKTLEVVAIILLAVARILFSVANKRKTEGLIFVNFKYWKLSSG